MGMFSKVMKTGAAAKAMQVAKREASKPENQQKAKNLVAKVRNRGKGGPTAPPSAPPPAPPPPPSG